MKPTGTPSRLRAALVAVTLTAGTGIGLGLGATSAQAAVPILDGNAPQCIHTWTGTDGTWWDTQTAYNACDQAYRVKLVWAVASGDCETLNPGDSMTGEVLKPAWGNGADLC